MNTRASRHPTLRLPKAVALGLWGTLWLGNALWMLADPAGWYAGVDGVANTGPYNPHFVRDIGMAYLTLALLAFAAIRWTAHAVALIGAGTLFLAALESAEPGAPAERKMHGMSRRSKVYKGIDTILSKDWMDREDALAQRAGSTAQKEEA